jgi:hypothetical protein
VGFFGSLLGFLGNFFADGGIMTGRGPLALHRYAWGGIANAPQLAMYGEGSTPEAYVPLPDGRSIPVTMSAPPANSNWQGGGGPIAYAPVISISAPPGADRKWMEQTAAEMDRRVRAGFDGFRQSINSGGADSKVVGRRRK